MSNSELSWDVASYVENAELCCTKLAEALTAAGLSTKDSQFLASVILVAIRQSENGHDPVSLLSSVSDALKTLTSQDFGEWWVATGPTPKT